MRWEHGAVPADSSLLGAESGLEGWLSLVWRGGFNLPSTDRPESASFCSSKCGHPGDFRVVACRADVRQTVALK